MYLLGLNWHRNLFTAQLENLYLEPLAHLFPATRDSRMDGGTPVCFESAEGAGVSSCPKGH